MLNKSKLIAACAGVLVAGSAAQAALQLTLEVNPASSGAITHMGQTVLVDIYGKVTGTNNLKAEGVQMVSGSLISSGGVLGRVTAAGALISLPGDVMGFGVGTDQFAGPGSQAGEARDLDGDGDNDLGGVDTDDTANFGHFVLRAPGMVEKGQNPKILLGTVAFTVTDPIKAGNTTIRLTERFNGSGQRIAESALWQEDKTAKNPKTTGASITLGQLSLNNLVDPDAPGNKPSNPVLPTSVTGPDVNGIVTEHFTDMQSGVWADPPVTVQKITYTMVSPDSDFTGIVAFPAGFGSAMMLTLKGVPTGLDIDGNPILGDLPVGPFGPGGSVDIGTVDPDGAGALPILAVLGVIGVDEFDVTGMDGVTASTGFPLAVSFVQYNPDGSLNFDGVASYNVSYIVPEPASFALIGILV